MGMSEEPENYMGITHSLTALENRLQEIIQDTSTSHWLKQAVIELWDRDVVDALNDLDVLRELLEAKHQADRLLLEKWAGNHDGIRH